MSPIFVLHLNSSVGIASVFEPAGPEFEYSRNFCCYKQQYNFKVGFFSKIIQVESILVSHIFEKYKKNKFVWETFPEGMEDPIVNSSTN